MSHCPRCGKNNPAEIHTCTPNFGVAYWWERCETHPDHQQGMVTDEMIRNRMQEEIDDLRVALAEQSMQRLTVRCKNPTHRLTTPPASPNHP